MDFESFQVTQSMFSSDYTGEERGGAQECGWGLERHEVQPRGSRPPWPPQGSGLGLRIPNPGAVGNTADQSPMWERSPPTAIYATTQGRTSPSPSDLGMDPLSLPASQTVGTTKPRDTVGSRVACPSPAFLRPSLPWKPPRAPWRIPSCLILSWESPVNTQVK